MPFKLTLYLVRHSFIGISLSATAVLGFSYFLTLPGLKGSFVTRFILANEQLMQISHLIMPLVILIGIAYGLGLLHNHSEMIQVIQQFSSLFTMAVIITLFLVFTTFAELFIWPTFEAPIVAENSWVKAQQTYTDQNHIFIATDNNKIKSYRDESHTLGDGITNLEPIVAQLKNNATTTDSKWKPTNKKQQYQFWEMIHQALWPLPLFAFLWRQLNKTNRGSNAASIAGSVAMYAIALGLFAETTHIILAKALVAPWLTGLLPTALVSIVITKQIVKAN